MSGPTPRDVERPGFDLNKFRRIIMPYFFIWMACLFGLFYLLQWLLGQLEGSVSETTLFGLPFFNAQTRGGPTLGIIAMGGLAIGLVSFGGLALGGIAIGGGAVGIIALGGGSIGLVAMGGGAVGLISIGGGACGYIALGGGAVGVYALGGGGFGRYVLASDRQDAEAVRFFCKHLPRLREAFPDQPPEQTVQA